MLLFVNIFVCVYKAKHQILLKLKKNLLGAIVIIFEVFACLLLVK